jgi:hypothetical protein
MPNPCLFIFQAPKKERPNPTTPLAANKIASGHRWYFLISQSLGTTFVILCFLAYLTA